MLQTSYDLFTGKLNENPIWIGTSELLDEGIEKAGKRRRRRARRIFSVQRRHGISGCNFAEDGCWANSNNSLLDLNWSVTTSFFERFLAEKTGESDYRKSLAQTGATPMLAAFH